MAKQYVYHFEDAFGKGKELLGGKGAGLAEMTHIGVPIPQGFTITTEACTLYYNSNKTLPEFLIEDIKKAVKEVEAKTGKKFGGDKNPLLVSVRSGARVSMPGMMDTILNLGLNDKTQLVHTLNNTVVASPRGLIAVIENNYQEDGSILVPKPLQMYMGGIEVIKPVK